MAGSLIGGSSSSSSDTEFPTMVLNSNRHMKNHDAAPVKQGFKIFVKAE